MLFVPCVYTEINTKYHIKGFVEFTLNIIIYERSAVDMSIEFITKPIRGVRQE